MSPTSTIKLPGFFKHGQFARFRVSDDHLCDPNVYQYKEHTLGLWQNKNNHFKAVVKDRCLKAQQ